MNIGWWTLGQVRLWLVELFEFLKKVLKISKSFTLSALTFNFVINQLLSIKTINRIRKKISGVIELSQWHYKLQVTRIRDKN